MHTKLQIQRWLIGGLLPMVLGFLGVRYFTGRALHSKGSYIGETVARGHGLCFLGLALCIHAIFCGVYDGHPAVKWSLVILGAGVWLAGVMY
jgi:hypothetical protein